MKFAGRLAQVFVDSRLTVLFVLSALIMGACALVGLPREEEPQISVPFMDVFIPYPGATAKETEKRVLEPFERKIWEIPGVEYVYGTAQRDGALIVARFDVGSDESKSLVTLYTKVFANLDLLPPGAAQPIIKPKSIYDVPVLSLTFSGASSPQQLRAVAAQVKDTVNAVKNVSETALLGGHRRTLHVRFDPTRLAQSGVSVASLEQTIAGANGRMTAGHTDAADVSVAVGAGGAVRTADDLNRLVVGINAGAPLYLGDVAEVTDGPDDSEHDACMLASQVKDGPCVPAVTLSVAKRKGANAVAVVDDVLRAVDAMKKDGRIPATVAVSVERDYGHTAKQKADELLWHMFLATVSVTLLVAVTLGVREAAVVFVAIPVTLALTLFVYFSLGYTLNRITLFALIFSVGILVDDAIVVVENINRHCRSLRGKDLTDEAVKAVDEVGNPTILATCAVIAAILPMAFVHGLMGPYMRPIPVGASAAMFFSLAVAFIVSPWLFTAVLKRFPPKGAAHAAAHGAEDVLYHRFMGALIHDPRVRNIFFAAVAVLFCGAIALFLFKGVIVKMLPFDNKNEIQVVLNFPEGTAFAHTKKTAEALARAALAEPEVEHATVYAGASAPFNFNGLVRHYYLREKPWQADVMVVLHDRHLRKAQSHDVAKRLRARLEPMAKAAGLRMQIAEVPPGPPVLASLVAEVYADDAQRAALSQEVRGVFAATAGVADIDIFADTPYARSEFSVDNEKASLNGIAAADIAKTAQTALSGRTVDIARVEGEPEPVDIRVRMQERFRADPSGLARVTMFNKADRPVALGFLTQRTDGMQDGAIYHKNLRPVTYVTGEAVGRLESPAYAVFAMMPKVPATSVKWDGEWQITLEVFRDLGIAFALVLVLIYILVVGWFKSFTVPLVIMAPIPLTLVGIAPGHMLLHTFFSATSMIGMIAGAGIVVRNSIILVDFIEQKLREGVPLDKAVIDAGAVRFRPMLLTAAAVMIGASVMLSDPIFRGLAISLMFGEIASTLLSRNMVPVLYYLLKRKK